MVGIDLASISDIDSFQFALRDALAVSVGLKSGNIQIISISNATNTFIVAPSFLRSNQKVSLNSAASDVTVKYDLYFPVQMLETSQEGSIAPDVAFSIVKSRLVEANSNGKYIANLKTAVDAACGGCVDVSTVKSTIAVSENYKSANARTLQPSKGTQAPTLSPQEQERSKQNAEATYIGLSLTNLLILVFGGFSVLLLTIGLSVWLWCPKQKTDTDTDGNEDLEFSLFNVYAEELPGTISGAFDDASLPNVHYLPSSPARSPRQQSPKHSPYLKSNPLDTPRTAPRNHNESPHSNRSRTSPNSPKSES